MSWPWLAQPHLQQENASWIKSLEMQPTCHIISRVPLQTNIEYTVKAVGDQGLAVLTEPLVDELLTGKYRVTNNCQSYMERLKCVSRSCSGRRRENYGVWQRWPEQRRLVEKYDSCTDEQLKTAIFQSFIVPNGAVRVVVATCAFGMGIDCPNVYKVFLRGPPSTIAMYVQEIGWSSGSSNPLSCM